MKRQKGALICSILLIGIAFVYAQTPEWRWAVQAGGLSYDYGNDIAVDAVGDQFITGLFVGTASFGSFSLTSSGYEDIFVAKLDPAGNILWAIRAGGTSNERGQSIAVDSAGNTYLTGYFGGTSSFGPYTLTSSSGDFDIFAAKLDSSGNFLWAVSADGNSYGIDVDGAGNTYLTGCFSGTANFGPYSLISSGLSDIFTAKLDPEGHWLWAVKAGGTNREYSNKIAVDGAGNAYLTGEFNGTVIFGQYTITSNNYDIFVAKLDSEGHWLWAAKAGGASSDYGQDIAVDSAGNVYLTGFYQEIANFGPYTVTSSGYDDIFIAKLDTTGNFLWVVGAGGTQDDNGIGIDVDAVGNVYLTGNFSGTASFGPYSLTPSSYDIFAAKLDAMGNFLWAVSSGGTQDEVGVGIAVDAVCNTYLIGYFSGTASFGPYTITSSGSADIFISKISQPLNASFSADVTSGPEPLTVHFTDQSTFEEYPITNWLWTFGDGSSSNQQNPDHIYLTQGFFTVSLTINDQSDQSSTLTRVDYIQVITIQTVEILSTTYLAFGNVCLEEQSTWQPIILLNSGNIDLTIDNTHFVSVPRHFELSESLNNLILSPGNVDTLFVRFTPQSVGVFKDTLYIVNNSTNEPVVKIRLSGTGEYVPLKPPENMNILMNGYNVVITWNSVTQNTHNQNITPDYYLVFSSADPYNVFTYHGPTTGLSYIFPLVGQFQPRMFYHVIAYKYYGRVDFDISDLGLTPGMTEEDVFKIIYSEL